MDLFHSIFWGIVVAAQHDQQDDKALLTSLTGASPLEARLRQQVTDRVASREVVFREIQLAVSRTFQERMKKLIRSFDSPPAEA